MLRQTHVLQVVKETQNHQTFGWVATRKKKSKKEM